MYSTLTEVFLERTSGALKDRAYIQYKPIRGAAYHSITFGDFGERTRLFARGLRSLGLIRGDRIAIISESRPEWVMMDCASLALGLISAPMFPNLTAKQVEFVVNDCEARVLVVSNDFQLSKALKIAENCPTLTRIVRCVDETNLDVAHCPVPVISVSELLRAEAVLDFDLEARKAKPEDVITIIYTSGTTGTPKGVMLTHSNLLSNIEGAIAALPEISEKDVALSFLPLCHSFERVASYLFLYKGFTVAFAESVDTVADNLLEIRPTVMTGVPRFYERIHGRIMRLRERMPASKRAIFDWGLRIGAQCSGEWEGKSVPLHARLMKPIADRLVLDKIRERTGGRIRIFVSGGAALSEEVGRAFAAFGLLIIEGYGMTESSPIISVSPYNKLRWGSVGKPLPNVEVKIASDGEILTRGPHVMKGYYNRPEDTAEMIDTDDWLHTGDIGEFDLEGYLKITDRKKHLFVSSGGKNIAPAHIESLISQSRFVDQVLLLGDKRQYVSALIVPDFDVIREEFKKSGVTNSHTNEEIAVHDEVRRIIERDIEQYQREVSSYERVRRFALLPEPFSIENGLMTPTLKIKRKEVENRYADLIQSLYPDEK